jgi:hypothetical protein
MEMKIVCTDMLEVATLVRRCDAQRAGNHGCFNCLLYPFCTEGGYEERKQVEDFIVLEVNTHGSTESKGACHCRQ